MTHSATEPVAADAEARRSNAVSLVFFLAVLLALLVRICVSNAMLDGVYDYVREGGAFYQKIHVGTYLLLALLPVVLFTRPVYLRGEEIAKFRDLVRFGGLLVLLIALLVVTGRAGSSGSLIDTYLVAAAAGLILLAQNPSYRRLIGDVVLTVNLLSALLAIFEAATRMRIFPYSEGELVFRPTGLAGHPLTLGLLCAASIGFVPITRWRPWVKVGAVLLLFVGTAVSGARFSLILATVEVLVLIVLVPWAGLRPATERKAKLAVLLLVLAVGTVLIGVLAAGGFLSRFSEGVVDDNFYARTNIYRIFEYTSWGEVFFGADLTRILGIVNEKLRLPYIESTPVYLTYQLGLVLAIPFALLVFWLVWRLLRHQPRSAWIGTAVFLLAALSNNTLSQKTMVVTLLVVLLVAYIDPDRRKSPPAKI